MNETRSTEPTPAVPSRNPVAGVDSLRMSTWATLDHSYPGMRSDIEDCIRSLANARLTRDLIIKMPRLEEIDLEEALTSEPDQDADAEESLSDEIRGYASLLTQFNNYVGQGAEELLVHRLNDSLRSKWDPGNDRLLFVRNTVRFPDILLVRDLSGAVTRRYESLFHIELKSWYVFSRDPITARFHIAPQCIKKDSLLVIFPWYMTDIISGTPRLLSPLVYNARELAERRDLVWEHGGLNNLKKGIISERHRVQTPEPEEFFRFRGNKQNIKSEGYQKTSGGRWIKESDNFGKLHRLYYDAIYEFEDQTFSETALGKTLGDWHSLLN